MSVLKKNECRVRRRSLSDAQERAASVPGGEHSRQRVCKEAAALGGRCGDGRTQVGGVGEVSSGARRA